MCVKNLRPLPNPMEEFKTQEEKKRAYDLACKNNEFAYDCNLKKIPLKKLSLLQVAYVGGAWRVQKEFPYKITNVRKKQMILLEKLPMPTQWDKEEEIVYYKAAELCCNCYGFYIFDFSHYIVAKRETKNKGVLWGYGKTIESARAFLMLKEVDLCRNAIKECLDGDPRQRK